MKFFTAAMSLALLSCVSGCKSWTNGKTVLVGGERQMYFPAGRPVPYVRASDNTNGWYSVTADEMNAILNP